MIRKTLIFVMILFLPSIGMSQMKAIFGADTTYGCGNLTVQFLDSSIAATIDSWFWDFGNGDTSTAQNPIVTYDTTGVYTVKLVVSNATITDSVTKESFITVRQKPIADFIIQKNETYYNTDTLWLTTFNYLLQDNSSKDTLPYDYYWDFGSGVFEDSTSKFVYKFAKESAYNIGFIIDAKYGCSDTIYKTIDVKDEIIIPNIFTPNGDGVNDVFFIRTNGYDIFKLEIFNRYGALVHITEAKHISWDGRTHAGVLVEPGTYFYVLESATRKEVGYLSLIR